MLVDAKKSTLLLVDMQERLLPAMTGGAEAEQRCAILLKAAKALAKSLVGDEWRITLLEVAVNAETVRLLLGNKGGYAESLRTIEP